MTTYYNENDPRAAAWLRNLIGKGLISHGDVDDRSIADVQPGDLRGYRRVHMFAGIGGWDYAARLAGWPEDRELWTGSCPCQPFSVAGKQTGTDDPRHLWPDFFRLISAYRPAVVMGEQVSRKAGMGWFDGVRSDLEGAGYASRALDIPACAIDAPHIRSRLWWCAVADAVRERCEWREGAENWRHDDRQDAGRIEGNGAFTSSHEIGGNRVGDATSFGWREGRPEPELRSGGTAVGCPDVSGVAHGDADRSRLAIGRSQPGHLGAECPPAERADGRNGSFWADAEWIACHDGKARRTKPGLPLLANGIPGRVAKWRGMGNAIVPQVAAEIIKAFLECRP